jgi:outer membrane protein assembly factor BamB
VALDASALVLRVGELDDFHRALSELVGDTQSNVLLRSLITILIAGLAVHGAAAQDYPGWRGALRDGTAAAFRVPAAWPERLTRRWRVEVGEGYATPLLVGDTIYVFSRRDGQEVMSALDAASGAVRWRSGYPAPYTPSKPTMAHGSGPKATPVFHDGKLFTQGVSGIVAAFDAATGKLLWQTAAPAEQPIFSAASSPVGVDGLVVVHPGNYGPLTAFDVGTGVVKWTAGASGLFASPFVATLAGIRQIVTGTSEGIIGVAPEDGTLLWRFPWPDKGGAVTPLLRAGTIFVGGFEMGVAAFRLERRDGAWVAHPLWTTKDVSLYLSNAVVVGDTLFGFSHRASGQLFALDADAGRTLWLGPAREAGNSAIAAAGDLVFYLHDDGELIVAKASRAGLEPLKRYTVADSPTWAQPVLVGNRMLIKDATAVAMWAVE